MTLIKSKINSLVWLKSAVYLSIVGGVIFFSKSASASSFSLINVDINLNFGGLFNHSGSLTPVFANYTEDEYLATLVLQAGLVEKDSTRSFVIAGNYWKGSLTLNLTDDNSDRVSLGGTFWHNIGLHTGESQTGTPFQVSLLGNAVNAIDDKISRENMKDWPHGPNHSDTFKASLLGTVFSTEKKHQIQDWSIVLTANHPQPVPEPTTIFGSALALGVGGWLKRKKSSQQNKTTTH